LGGGCGEELQNEAILVWHLEGGPKAANPLSDLARQTGLEPHFRTCYPVSTLIFHLQNNLRQQDDDSYQILEDL
jgi:hypothetical protein